MFIFQDQITKYIQYYTKSFCGMNFKLFGENFESSIASLYCPAPGVKRDQPPQPDNFQDWLNQAS